MTPSETRTGATPKEVAAPAARPLRRGRRSHKARCRRWNSWHALVSHSLVALMLNIPFEASRDSLDQSVSHAIVDVRDRVRADDHVELACSSACPAASAAACAVAAAAAVLAASWSLVRLLRPLLRLLARSLRGLCLLLLLRLLMRPLPHSFPELVMMRITIRELIRHQRR